MFHIFLFTFSLQIGNFKCADCDKLFQQENFVFRHRALEHPPGDEYICPECKKKLPSKAELLNHLRIHPVKTVKCQGCSREFTRKYHLDRHIGQTGCMGEPKKAFDCRVIGFSSFVFGRLTEQILGVQKVFYEKRQPCRALESPCRPSQEEKKIYL